jgi:hypothetical protein
MPGDIAGIGIIAAQRQGIGAAVAVMEYAARYFDGGTMPSYVIKSDNPDLTEDEADLLKLKWMEHYSGRSRRPAVMNSTTTVEPLTANASDSQLVEARNQAIADAANLPGRVAAYELDLDAIPFGATLPSPRVSPFPAVFQDLSLVVDDGVPASAVIDAVRDGAGDLLEAVTLFDVYTGPQIGEGRKSLTLALRFRATDRTLTEDEASAARDTAVAVAGERFGAALRG